MTPLRLQMIEDMKSAGLAAANADRLPRRGPSAGRPLSALAGSAERGRGTRAICLVCVTAAWRSAPSRPITAASSFSTAGRSIATGRCSQKKNSPAQANAASRGPVRRASPRAAGRREDSRPQGLLRPHVRLRPAHQRGRDPRDRRHRRRQSAASHHRQGQQGAARAAAAAGPR